ncbi:Plasmodium vivax Vir protein, putative [Plasmodium vivax]|uniref:Vir protein, putative n=1 Tax=Plasmodium vivax TaxID=5855 RepID=A0A1G4E296_PLAVI|nr:Plasmodium vivax Vir protein, putative [Plasmodium vivax]
MCSKAPKEGSYDFFKNIEKYIDIAKSAESNAELTKPESKAAWSKAEIKCNSFMESSKNYLKDKLTAKHICKQFIKLYYSLTDLNKCILHADTDYIICNNFLNYWINFKLRESVLNDDDSFCNSYNGIESQFTFIDEHDINLYKIYHIDKDELDKMNKLYNLYEKYSEINSIIVAKSEQDKQKLLTLSTQCCRDYNEASYICNPENNINNNNSKFCQELNKFKSKYNELDGKVREQASELSDYFIGLSECPNTKIITTAVTGSIIGLIPLVGVLYKFTPMGQMFRSKIGILNNDISNNDDEMTNISFMEQENEPLRFQQGKYNIKYQSL